MILWLSEQCLYPEIYSTFTEPPRGVVDAVAAPLESAVEPVRIHCGQDVEVGRLEDLSVELEDVLDQVDEELAAHGLVAVHVGHHLHHRPQELVLALKRWEMQTRNLNCIELVTDMRRHKWERKLLY